MNGVCFPSQIEGRRTSHQIQTLFTKKVVGSDGLYGWVQIRERGLENSDKRELSSIRYRSSLQEIGLLSVSQVNARRTSRAIHLKYTAVKAG